MQPQALLKRLDAPVHFLSFSMNDLIAHVTPFFIGALFDSLFIVPAIGSILVIAMKKILKKFPKFTAIRYAYWSFPTNTFNQALKTNFPPSHKRLWVK